MENKRTAFDLPIQNLIFLLFVNFKLENVWKRRKSVENHDETTYRQQQGLTTTSTCELPVISSWRTIICLLCTCNTLTYLYRTDPSSPQRVGWPAGSNRSKILGIIPQPRIDMAETRQDKASEAKLKTTGNVLAFGPQIQVIHRKQTSTM
jgi:hypothetical protein